MNKSIITDQTVINKIYLIRGLKVMLDRDLAEMYGVETKLLKRQVRRNITRFPEDFMFELTPEEWDNLRCQFGTSSLKSQNATSSNDSLRSQIDTLNLRTKIASSSWGGVRYPPMVFTEQGVAMLSSVLNSETAIEVNIQIIRIFTKMREMLITHKDIFLKLEQIENKILSQDSLINKHEEEIQMIFTALKQLLNPPDPPRQKIGYKA